MKIGIGNGDALARRLSAAGRRVAVANSKGVEAVRFFTDESGATAVDISGAVAGAGLGIMSKLPKDSRLQSC